MNYVINKKDIEMLLECNKTLTIQFSKQRKIIEKYY